MALLVSAHQFVKRYPRPAHHPGSVGTSPPPAASPRWGYLANPAPDRRAEPDSRPTPRSAKPAARGQPTPPWWFAAPAMALFAFVVLIPSVRGVWYAFTDWNGLDPDFAFVGFDNFREVTRDPDARQAIGNTLLIAVAI